MTQLNKLINDKNHVNDDSDDHFFAGNDDDIVDYNFTNNIDQPDYEVENNLKK